MEKKLKDKMVIKNWQDVIGVNYPDIPEEIPGYLTNRDLEARRKRLNELAILEYRKFQKSIQSQEPSKTNISRWLHYTYSGYEIMKYLLN